MRVAQWHAFGAVALICWAQWHASTRLGWGWPLHVVWGGQGSGVALRRLFAPSWWWIGVAAGISVLVHALAPIWVLNRMWYALLGTKLSCAPIALLRNG